MTDARVLTAGDVGYFKGGSGFPLRLQGHRTGQLPFFKVSDMNNPGNELFMEIANNYIGEATRKKMGAVRIPAGAIVFAKVGAAVFLERKRILAQDSCIDNNMAAFIVDPAELDVRFAHYLLTDLKLGDLVATTALPSLNGGQMRSIPLRMPGLAEQRDVVDALSSIDDLITSLEHVVAKKCAIKRGLMQELLTGGTRLPGFTGEWQTVPFDAVAKPINTRGSQVEAREYELSGALTVVDQGQAKIAGYTNRAMRPIEPDLDGLLVFGDHTCVTKYIDFPFVAGADGTKVLKSTDNRTFSIRFIAYLLEHDPIEQSGYNRHFSKLRERNFSLPMREEQQAVVSILADIDEEINSLGRRLESTRAIKQGMMQELLTGRTRLPVAEEVSV